MSERRRIRLIALSTVRPLLGSSVHRAATYVCVWAEFVATATRVVLDNGKMHPHKPSHRLPHLQSAHTGGKKKQQTTALRQLAEGQPAKGVGESERQESPYIAHRKSCVRTGSSLFGHGGFLVHSKTDISSTVGFWREYPSGLEGDCMGGGSGGPGRAGPDWAGLGRTCSAVSAAVLPPSLPAASHSPATSLLVQAAASGCGL